MALDFVFIIFLSASLVVSFTSIVISGQDSTREISV